MRVSEEQSMMNNTGIFNEHSITVDMPSGIVNSNMKSGNRTGQQFYKNSYNVFGSRKNS